MSEFVIILSNFKFGLVVTLFPTVFPQPEISSNYVFKFAFKIRTDRPGIWDPRIGLNICILYLTNTK